jgi:hypothetical protein
MPVGAKSSVTAASLSLSGVFFGCVDLVSHLVCAIFTFAVAIVRL